MENVFLLPSNKPSRLSKNTCFDNVLELWEKDVLSQTQKDKCIKDFNLYITSDEEINKEDYCLYNKNHNSENPDWELVKCGEIEREEMHPISEGRLLLWMIKIVLTTDQDLIDDGVQEIDDELLEWFLDNSSCKFVEVKGALYFDGFEWISCYKITLPNENIKQENCCTPTGQIKRYKDCIGCDRKPKQKLKIGDKTNFGVVVKIDDKSAMFGTNKLGVEIWHKISDVVVLEEFNNQKITLEQAALDFSSKYLDENDESSAYNSQASLTSFIAGAQWQAERMHSDEEVISLLEKSHLKHAFTKSPKIRWWFEQFKKIIK